VSKLQRILLILFAVLVLFSGSSHLFLAAILLFFGLSPVNWFNKKQREQDVLSSLVSEEHELSALPTIGFLTSEKLLLLKSLIKLRSAEIGNIYLQVRQYQKEAENGNWVPIFMKQMAVSDLHEPYNHVEKEEEEKAEAEAMAIFEERYKFCSIAPTGLYEDQIADLHVALLYWRYSPQTVINRLEELKSFGFLEDCIDPLIKSYQIIDKCGGGFKSIFKKKTGSFKPALDRISHHWSEIIRIAKMNMFLDQIKNDTSNEHHIEENTELREIEALVELDRFLDCAITQENLDRKSCISLPPKEKEEFLLNRLKFNPLWYHYS
jgi:hypothetical protein